MLHQQTPNRNSFQQNVPKPPQTTQPTIQPQSQTQTAPTTSSNANKTSSQTPPAEGQSSGAGSLTCCSTFLPTNFHRIPSTVLLQTALVKVVGVAGNILWARALLDPASQLNILSENLAQRLQLPKVKDHHTIGGIGQSTIVSTHAITAQIQSHCCNFRTQLKFHILGSVTRELPSNHIEVTEWNLPADIILADPQFNLPGSIDMIIGVDGVGNERT